MKTAGSTYARLNKSRRADRYGSWTNGVQIRTDLIAGNVLAYDHNSGKWRGAVKVHHGA